MRSHSPRHKLLLRIGHKQTGPDWTWLWPSSSTLCHITAPPGSQWPDVSHWVLKYHTVALQGIPFSDIPAYTADPGLPPWWMAHGSEFIGSVFSFQQLYRIPFNKGFSEAQAPAGMENQGPGQAGAVGMPRDLEITLWLCGRKCNLRPAYMTDSITACLLCLLRSPLPPA